MAQTPEGWVKDQIKKILEDRHIHYHMPMTMGYGKSGEPDFDFCLYGLYVKLEAKDDALRHRRGELISRGKNKGKVVREGAPTHLQQLAMHDIRRSGGVTLVIDQHNYQQLALFIDEVRAIITAPDLRLSYKEWLGRIIKCAMRNDIFYSRTPELECISTQ